MAISVKLFHLRSLSPSLLGTYRDRGRPKAARQLRLQPRGGQSRQSYGVKENGGARLSSTVHRQLTPLVRRDDRQRGKAVSLAREAAHQLGHLGGLTLVAALRIRVAKTDNHRAAGKVVLGEKVQHAEEAGFG